MAQKFSQNTAQSGGMSKDIDDRLLKSNEYRDLLNGNVGRSEGANIGVIENVRGNALVAAADQAGITGTTIGVVADEANGKIYWAVASPNFDAWYEYDEATDTVSTVLIDGRLSGLLTFNLADVSCSIFPDGTITVASVVGTPTTTTPTFGPVDAMTPRDVAVEVLVPDDDTYLNGGEVLTGICPSIQPPSTAMPTEFLFGDAGGVFLVGPAGLVSLAITEGIIIDATYPDGSNAGVTS